MARSALGVTLILLSVLVGVFWSYPMWNEISVIKAKKEEIQSTLDRINALARKRDEIQEQYNSLSPDDLVKLNEFFPKNKGYEMQRVYEFTKDQKNLYLDLVDRIYLKHKLPKPSNYYLDFYVCRCIWSAARMGKWPKIQQWRYEQSKKVIRNYLRLNSKIRL